VFIVSERSITETGGKIQVPWGYIYGWRRARRRTGHPNEKLVH